MTLLPTTRRVAAGTIAATMAGGLAFTAAAQPASAHEIPGCWHYDVEQGGWFIDYIDHYNRGGWHYNFYIHYGGGTSHPYEIKCG